jgi:hypothetical protein
MFYLRLFFIIVTITMILVSIMYYNFANIERFKDIQELTLEFLKEDLDKLKKKVDDDNKYLKDNIDTNKTNIDRYYDDFTKFINKKDKINICSNSDCSEITKINKDLNIKSDNINILNENDYIISKFNNNEIYLGGDKDINSPLFIINDNVNINRLNAMDLYVNSENKGQLLNINKYIDWIDENIEYNLNKEKINTDNNKDRIKDILRITEEIEDIKNDRNNLNEKIEDNIKKYESLNQHYQNIQSLDTKFTSKYNLLEKLINEKETCNCQDIIDTTSINEETNKKIQELDNKIQNISDNISSTLEEFQRTYNIYKDSNEKVNQDLFNQDNKTLEEHHSTFDKLLEAAVSLGIPRDKLT